MSNPFPPSTHGPLGDPFGQPTKARGPVVAVVLALVLLAGGAAVVFFVLANSDEDADGANPGLATLAPDALPSPGASPSPPESEAPAGTTTTVAAATTTLAPLEPPAEANYFLSAQAVPALEAIADQIGGQPTQFLQVVFYPTYVIVQVQLPGEPEFVDRVVWRDLGVATQDPVRLFPGTDLDVALFTLDDVPWEALDRLVSGAVELTGVHEGEVTHVIVERPLPFDQNLRWRVFVNGPRNSGYLDADVDGNVTAVN